MKINDDIRQALNKAIEANYNMSNFSKKIKTPPSTVSRWIKGEIKNISDNLWEITYPYLKPYLKEQYTVKNLIIQNIIEDKPQVRELLEVYQKLNSEGKRLLAEEKIAEILNTLKAIDKL